MIIETTYYTGHRTIQFRGTWEISARQYSVDIKINEYKNTPVR